MLREAQYVYANVRVVCPQHRNAVTFTQQRIKKVRLSMNGRSEIPNEYPAVDRCLSEGLAI